MRHRSCLSTDPSKLLEHTVHEETLLLAGTRGSSSSLLNRVTHESRAVFFAAVAAACCYSLPIHSTVLVRCTGSQAGQPTPLPAARCGRWAAAAHVSDSEAER
ncbi:hypothetical protein ABPG75_002035 [Micractinium tetrahymenae]